MNISPLVDSLNVADWDEAVIEEMDQPEIAEYIGSFKWERLHYESILAEFEPGSRQARYARNQVDALDTIVGRLEAAQVPAGHDWKPVYE